MRNHLADYHLHTGRCGHAAGEMQEYVEVAIERGLGEIGFSDHLPLVTHRDATLTMAEDELHLYVEEVLRLQHKYRGQIVMKLGIEADFVPGYEERTRELLKSYDWDYVIGSVHDLGGWAFDHPKEIGEWARRNVDEVYRRYYEILGQAASSGLFDIVGHCDLAKKFGHRPQADLCEEVESLAGAIRDSGMVVEINTSGLRKPVQEIYPALSILEVFKRYDIPLVLGSDAHQPGEVGQDFDLALEWARQAGYRETVVFSKRKIVQRVPIVV